MGRIRYGTSSWTAKGWVGSFYPDGTQQTDFLRHYAQRFDTVEVDSTYYGVPRPSTVDGWAEKTPDGFVMSAKFPRSVVHGGDGRTPDRNSVLVPSAVEDEVDEFLRVMGRLGDKCGTLVLQFPFFNRDVFPGIDEFLRRLDDFLDILPRRFRYAVEVRNKGFVGAPLLDVLRRHQVAFTLLDLSYMPHPDTWWDKFGLITADHVYVRLIGDRKAVDEITKTFDKTVIDRGAQIRRWARMLKLLQEGAPDVCVYANNHFAGHAPATLGELMGLVEVA